MTDAQINSVVVVGATLIAALVLFHPKVLRSTTWKATVTPLASIIGSGFLILGPLLKNVFGSLSLPAMLGLCVAAYALGSAIRFNIMSYDRTDAARLPSVVIRLEKVASGALIVAYVISVCYYLNLFGAFAVSLTPVDDPWHARIVTTVVLACIGCFGYLRGLNALERLEEVTVGVKLAIIGGLLVGLAAYAGELLAAGHVVIHAAPAIGLESMFVAFGLVVTVQGFETSRYLGEEYDAPTRARTMRLAQMIASGIYIVYIGLVTLDFSTTNVPMSETAIIDMTRVVAPVLPALLVCAALSAQLSAAVADTAGCGGLAQETSRRRVPASISYVLIAIAGIVLTWTLDIFSIIAFASRAFAVYYALQAAIALAFTLNGEGRTRYRLVIGFAGMLLFALAIAVLGRPAE